MLLPVSCSFQVLTQHLYLRPCLGGELLTEGHLEELLNPWGAGWGGLLEFSLDVSWVPLEVFQTTDHKKVMRLVSCLRFPQGGEKDIYNPPVIQASEKIIKYQFYSFFKSFFSGRRGGGCYFAALPALFEVQFMEGGSWMLGSSVLMSPDIMFLICTTKFYFELIHPQNTL